MQKSIYISPRTFFACCLGAFLLFIPLFHSAQGLERKGTLGILMKNNEQGDGLLVEQVFSPTTASQIGLEVDDLILSINGQDFNDVYDLVDAVGTWRKNDPISVELLRDGKKKNLKGKVVGKPLEQSAHAEVVYGEVAYDGGQLRSILELPKDVSKPPVVLFLPGVGCGSLDYFYDPQAPIKLLVEALVAEGIAVYRVEKPGMGDSQGTQDCLEMDFNYEVAAFDAALKQLKAIPEIDAEHIFLYGHSLGTISAPLVASKNKVAGIIAWGGISTTWYEYALKLERDQKTLFGMDYVEIDEEFRRVHPFLYDFYVKRLNKAELAAIPEYADLMDEHFHQGELWHGLHHYSYFQTLNQVDLLSAYKAADCPVLALAGEHDIHAIDTKWAGDIAAAVNYYRPGDGYSKVISKTTHHYHTVPSIAAYNDLRANGGVSRQYMAQNFNPEVPQTVQTWIKEQVAASLSGGNY